MKKHLIFTFFFACLLALVPACDKSSGGTGNSYLDQADCSGIDAAANSYTNTIKAILDAECATSGCHDPASKKFGIDLSVYAKAKTAFENKDCLCAIHHGSDCLPMPQGRAKLSDDIIRKIDCWAKNGYTE